MLSPRWSGAGVLLLVAAMLAVAAPPVWAGKGAAPAVNEVFDASKPATVMVVVVYGAVISVPANSHVPDAKVAQLQRELLARVRAGQLPATESALKKAALEAFIADPIYYLEPSDERETHERTMSGQGSGFFVTPDGYCVTNAHVVNADEGELKKQFVISVLSDLVDKTVKELKQAFPEQVSQQMIENLKRAAVAWYVEYMRLESLTTQYLVLTGVAVPGRGAEKKGMKAELVTKGSMDESKDVAILKVEGKNLPTLPVGDDSTLKTGDPIYCIGYPAAATFQPWADEASTIEATCTSGTMSARKTWSGGVEVIQTDAAITHGNSGGPALDKNGDVIGLTTWGSTAQQQTSQGDVVQTEVQGMNFLVPISVVKQFLDRSNVKPELSTVTQLYRQAVRKINQQHYKSAKKLLEQINALAPGSPYAEQYLAEAQKGISEGKDKSYMEWLPTVLIVAVVIVLLVGGIVVGVSRKRGAKAYPPAPGLGAPAPTLPAPRVVASQPTPLPAPPPAPPTTVPAAVPPPPPPPSAATQAAPAVPPATPPAAPPAVPPAAPPSRPPAVGATDADGANDSLD